MCGLKKHILCMLILCHDLSMNGICMRCYLFLSSNGFFHLFKYEGKGEFKRKNVFDFLLKKITTHGSLT